MMSVSMMMLPAREIDGSHKTETFQEMERYVYLAIVHFINVNEIFHAQLFGLH